jgi:hypothetical protein
MSKRLQVVVRDDELERYSRTAQSAGMTLSEWARQALRTAALNQSSGDIDAKLDAIRRAATLQQGGREADVGAMLAETEAGHMGRRTPQASSDQM